MSDNEKNDPDNEEQEDQVESPKGDSLSKLNEESNEGSPIIPEEILEAFPEEDRGRIKHVISQQMFSGVMRSGNPIAEKITPEHITQIIGQTDKHDQRDRDERKGQRHYNLTLLVIALAVVIFLIVFLYDKNVELLNKIVIAIISFIGGLGLGKSGLVKRPDSKD